MTIGAMHLEFRLLMDKADSGSAPAFLSTEIDLFLNAAIEKFITKRTFGGNPRKTGVEENQKRRDDLRNLIKNYEAVPNQPNSSNKEGGQFVPLPKDYRHSLSEECVVKGAPTKKVPVKPLTYDRYTKVIDDPFNTISPNVVYRLDYQGDKFELLSTGGVNKYYLRYISIPDPVSMGIGDAPFVNCSLAEHTHREIVRMAVLEALENIQDPRYQSSKSELNEIE
tara:strand:+ start:99 stop:770 length:672 start_codon:yes stop_codon:yes gene_type:complete